MKIDLRKGKEAFWSGCPSCGVGLRDYFAGDDETKEWWEFGCGCVLLKDDQALIDIHDPCPDAMQTVIEGLVFVDATEPPNKDKSDG